MNEQVDFYLDITAEVCPMTFVRTKLVVERMASGQTAEVRLQGFEPLANVPRSLEELGYLLSGPTPEPGQPEHGVHRLLVRKR